MRQNQFESGEVISWEGIARYPELVHSVIHNLCVNLCMLLGMVEEHTFYQLPAEQLEGTKKSRLTQYALAARLGTVGEVVARSLRELERSRARQVIRGHNPVIDNGRPFEWTQRP